MKHKNFLIISFFIGIAAFGISSVHAQYTNDDRSIDALLASDDVKTSIDLGDVLSGGVPKDGIPPIDEPKVVGVVSAPDWLNPEGDGIFVERNNVARFYPYQVLVSHEIVNDTFQGEDLLVTYCPLCFTGVVFDPTLEGVSVEFGVSGKLWESNLLMYNRSDPESLWSQALGEAVIGPATGQVLPVVRFDITTYAKFAEAFPSGEVVVGDAESRTLQSYSRIPYGGDLRDISPIFPFSGDDDRLPKTEIVLGIVVNNVAKAYPVAALESIGIVRENIGGQEIHIVYNNDTGVAEFYRGDSTEGERLTPIPSFWISWVSVHPDTEVYPLAEDSLVPLAQGKVSEKKAIGIFDATGLSLARILAFGVGLILILFAGFRYFSRLR